MKRVILYTLSILLVFTKLNAQDLQPEKIVKVARNFLMKSSKLKNYNQETQFVKFSRNDTVLLYLAHNNKNFVLIANDLRVNPILGYTDEGTYTGDHMPPQLKELIESYKYEILSLKRGNVAYKKTYNDEWEQYLSGEFNAQKTMVSPLIKVTWNQGSGWNRYCPEDPDGPGGHVYAGCVAISMAQSMSVYKHPDVGVGQSSYVSDYGALTVNYGETEYNWDLMSNTSSDDYNSLLIYHCAVAVEMSFAPDGSGAYTRDIASALRNYFDYSSDVYSANSTEDDAWVELLKSELDAGRPISYGGNNGSDEGHAFNLDGYNNSDAFHVNWGWSGSYNGYFQITNLTPNGSDYSKNATAVLNIQPMDHSPYDIELSTTDIIDTLKMGDIAAIISVSDPDEDDVHTLSVKGTNSILDNPYCPFYIDGDSLKLSETINSDVFEKFYIEITAVDMQNNEFKKDFTLHIIKENSKPTGISLSNSIFDDTLSVGSLVGTFKTIDPDEVDTFTYTFEINNNSDQSKDNSKFIISNDSLLINYDFTNYSNNECNIFIKSSDRMGESITKVFTLTINKPTGVNIYSNNIENSIKLYPNPTSDYITISNIKENIDIKKFYIYNTLGNLCKVIDVNRKDINVDISNYQAGIYFVKIHMKSGETKTFKVIKRD